MSPGCRLQPWVPRHCLWHWQTAERSAGACGSAASRQSVYPSVRLSTSQSSARDTCTRPQAYSNCGNCGNRRAAAPSHAQRLGASDRPLPPRQGPSAHAQLVLCGKALRRNTDPPEKIQTLALQGRGIEVAVGPGYPSLSPLLKGTLASGLWHYDQASVPALSHA